MQVCKLVGLSFLCGFFLIISHGTNTQVVKNNASLGASHVTEEPLLDKEIIDHDILA